MNILRSVIPLVISFQSYSQIPELVLPIGHTGDINSISSNGKNFLHSKTNEINNDNINIPLSRGPNLIAVSVMYERGVESIEEYKYIYYKSKL